MSFTDERSVTLAPRQTGTATSIRRTADNLALDEFRVYVWNLTVDTDDKGGLRRAQPSGYQHPHVGSEGAICWGDYETEARTYRRAGQ